MVFTKRKFQHQNCWLSSSIAFDFGMKKKGFFSIFYFYWRIISRWVRVPNPEHPIVKITTFVVYFGCFACRSLAKIIKIYFWHFNIFYLQKWKKQKKNKK